MKQHISIEQLNELSKKEREQLRKWWIEKHKPWYKKIGEGPPKCGWKNFYPNYYDLNIGRLIEFLTDNEYGERKLHYTQKPMRRTEDDKQREWVWTNQWLSTYFSSSYRELCDALWEAVRVVLESK